MQPHESIVSITNHLELAVAGFIKRMQRSLLFAGAVLALVSGAGHSVLAQTRVPIAVYSTLEPENVSEFKRAFEAENPDLEIVWIRDATGVVTARILAAGENQQAEAIWGLAVTSMLQLKAKGLLLPYAPPNLAELKPQFRDKADPPSWIGMEAWVGALCFNTAEAEKHKLPQPKSWFDLTDPVYKGHLVMPNPASSGTGYYHVSSWIQLFGEEKAWAFMDKLHPNIALYEHGGSKPCRMAAAGEFAIGISTEITGAQMKTRGAKLETLLMKEGNGWDMDTAAILKGAKNLDAARRIVNFAASRKANELYAKHVSQVAIAGISKDIPNYPAGVAEAMIKNDLEWASENRDRILAEWTRRYGKGQ